MSEYVFDLYIAGHTNRSKLAAQNIQEFCDQFFPGDYELHLIDVLENPQAAEEDKIIATPTLVQRAPISGRRIIGVISDHQAMLQALGLEDLQEEL
ncbi:MAG: circadian clock KaiB family protein [Desulfohalobiaceae bacterium]